MQVQLTRKQIWALLDALDEDAKRDALQYDKNPDLKRAWFILSGQVTDNA